MHLWPIIGAAAFLMVAVSAQTPAQPARTPATLVLPYSGAVDERWISKDLGLIGLAKSSGRNGERTARIQNVERKQPDPVLFVIPLDYTIRDLKMGPDQ
jgi:hypothetical protein